VADDLCEVKAKRLNWRPARVNLPRLSPASVVTCPLVLWHYSNVARVFYDCSFYCVRVRYINECGFNLCKRRIEICWFCDFGVRFTFQPPVALLNNSFFKCDAVAHRRTLSHLLRCYCDIFSQA